MPDENPQPPEAKPEPNLLTSSAPVPPSFLETTYRGIAGEITKFTISGIFILYSIGFLIWHSFLGTYGVSSVEFLQTEYLAAAFCYLFFLATFACPPFLLIAAILHNINTRGGIRGIKQWDDKIFVVIMIWNYLTGRTLQVFLPDSTPLTDRDLMIFGGILLVILLHIFVMGCFFVFVGLKRGYFMALWCGREKKPYNWRESKFYKITVHREYFYLYFLGLSLFSLFTPQKLNPVFLHSTIFLFLWFSSYLTLKNTFQTLTSRMMMHVVIISSVVLLIVLNVQSFGINQFKEIPKTVGGGRPETAYIKFDSGHSDVPKSLGIPRAMAVGSTNDYYGPIGILLRSQSEILFVNYADTNISEFTHNRLDSNPEWVTNKNTGFVVTNLVNDLSRDIVKSVNGLTARQVKSDLVDSIVFAHDSR